MYPDRWLLQQITQDYQVNKRHSDRATLESTQGGVIECYARIRKRYKEQVVCVTVNGYMKFCGVHPSCCKRIYRRKDNWDVDSRRKKIGIRLRER